MVKPKKVEKRLNSRGEPIYDKYWVQVEGLNEDGDVDFAHCYNEKLILPHDAPVRKVDRYTTNPTPEYKYIPLSEVTHTGEYQFFTENRWCQLELLEPEKRYTLPVTFTKVEDSSESEDQILERTQKVYGRDYRVSIFDVSDLRKEI